LAGVSTLNVKEVDKMDKGAAKDWSWLPQHMPGVARLVAEKRRDLGNAHVNACWKSGVVDGKPGFFYAVEGPLAVGTPWDQEVVSLYQGLPGASKAMVFMRTEAVAHGA
jgi:hypothetical protein